MSSNVIQTNDQTGKLKFQNLDSAFGGKLEDLLTLGKGEVKAGVVVAEPYAELVIPAGATTAKVSGEYKRVFVTAANTDPCDIDISAMTAPIGSEPCFVLLASDGDLTISGHGLSGVVFSSTKWLEVCPNGSWIVA